MKTTEQMRIEQTNLKSELKASVQNRVLHFTEFYKVASVDLMEFDKTIFFKEDHWDIVDVIELAPNGFHTDDGVCNREYDELTIEQLSNLCEALDLLFDMHKGELPEV